MQVVGDSESNLVHKIENIKSEIQSYFEGYKVCIKSYLDSISDKISDHIEELQETKSQVSQLPLQIKTIIQNEFKNIQNSCAKRPYPLDLESINITLTPKRKVMPSTPSFNYFQSRNHTNDKNE